MPANVEEVGDRDSDLPRTRLVLIFAGLGFLGGAAVVPLALAISGSNLAQSGISPVVVLLASGTQSAALAAVAAFIGVSALQRAGLGLPFFLPLARGEKMDRELLAAQVLPSLGMGAGVAVVIIALDLLVFGGLGAVGSGGSSLSTLATGLLASLYGGLVEEILLRLGLMTALAALLAFVWRQNEDLRIWVSIAVSAVLFGLGHLPATASLVPLTLPIVLRAIVLNGIGGVLFGWLYWRRGLLLAMLAHWSADIVLQTASVLLS